MPNVVGKVLILKYPEKDFAGSNASWGINNKILTKGKGYRIERVNQNMELGELYTITNDGGGYWSIRSACFAPSSPRKNLPDWW